MNNAFKTSVIALKDKLFQYEERNNIVLDSSKNEVDARIDQVRVNSFYRRYFIEQFLKFKEVQKVKREQPLFPDDFFKRAKTEYIKYNEFKTAKKVWKWAIYDERALPLRQSFTLRRDEVIRLSEGNEVSENILGDIVVSIDVLLAENIGMSDSDYGKLFSDNAVDFAVLTNLVSSKDFMQHVKPVTFTKGFVNILNGLGMTDQILTLFRDKLGSGWIDRISLPVLCQESNLRKLRSRERDVQFLLEQEEGIVAGIKSYLEKGDTGLYDDFYNAAPFAFIEIAKTVVDLISFVKDGLSQKAHDITQIFHRHLSDFQIEINLFALQDWHIPILSDATATYDAKIEFLSSIHPRAFNRLVVSDTLPAKALVTKFLSDDVHTDKLFRKMNGDSLVYLSEFIAAQGIVLQLPANSKLKSKLIGLVFRKLSEASDYRKSIIHFARLANTYVDDLTKEVKPTLNEALSNFISKGVLEDALYELFHKKDFVLSSVQSRFDERFSMSSDSSSVVVSYDVNKLNPVKPKVFEPGIQEEIIKTTESDFISDTWGEVTKAMIVAELTLGAVYFATPYFVKGPQGGEYQSVAGYVQTKVALLLKLGFGGLVASEGGHQACKTFFSDQSKDANSDVGASSKLVACPDSGYCVLSEGSIDSPIKCTVGELVCPDLDG